eukprot:EG_transcript_35275
MPLKAFTSPPLPASASDEVPSLTALPFAPGPPPTGHRTAPHRTAPHRTAAPTHHRTTAAAATKSGRAAARTWTALPCTRPLYTPAPDVCAPLCLAPNVSAPFALHPTLAPLRTPGTP